jgi:glycosyltransferase involved in cell wall biosynthesis
VTERDPRPSVALVLINNTGLGGAERRFAQVYEGLRRRNAPVALVINASLLARLRGAGLLTATDEPALILPEPMGRVAARLAQWMKPAGAAAGALAFGLRKLDYLLGCPRVFRWLRARRPQVMHVVLGGVYVALPLQMLHCTPPAVVSVTNPSLRAMVGAALGVKLFGLSLRRARIVDTLSNLIADAVRREGVDAARIRVAPGSSVDTARFRPAPAKRPWVVFSGRLIEEKNPALFIEACGLVAGRLRGTQPDLRFFVLGDGPLRADVERLIGRHGLQPLVRVGWLERVEPVLGEARVFVSLQRTDNYPSQALLEAMACGLAVVATDVGSTGKIVDGTVGRRVQADPAAVADAVVELLANPAQAEAMGRRARERVIRDHSMEAYLDYMERLYAHAC